MSVAFGDRDRRALASVATQFFVNGAVFASFIPRLPEIRERLDISLGALGAALTAAAAVGILGSVVTPVIIDRAGTRRTLIVGAAALIATLPTIALAESLVVFGIALGLMHAFDVAVDVAMNLQGSWLSARRHAPVMNRLHGLWSLGTVIGGLASSQLAGAGVSLRQHLFGVAIILGLALIFVGRGLLRVDEDHAEDDTAMTTGSQNVRATLVLFALGGAVAIAVEVVSSDWAAFRLRDDFETTVAFAGLGYVAYTSGMTVGRFGGDWFEVRLGSRRMLTIAIAIAAVGLTAASFFPNRYVVLLAYVLAGIGNATMFPKLYDNAARAPGPRGAAIGALTAGSRAMMLIAPIVIGSLAATSLSVGAAIAVITLPSLVGFAWVMLGRGR